MIFTILFVPSLFVICVMKYLFNKSISTKEFLLHILISTVAALVAIVVTYSVVYYKLIDTQILNSFVTDKYSKREICNEYSS